MNICPENPPLRKAENRKAASLSISRSILSMIENQQALPGCFFLYMLYTVHQVNLHLSGEGEVKASAQPD